MNVKSLLLLLAFTGFGVSCNSDDPNGSDGPNGNGGRTELQIAFSGTGEGQEYQTKATASESENKIDKLEIYLFASTAQGGPYYFLEKWTDGTAYDPANPTVTNFKKSETGTGWKASLYPNELKGLPYVRLMCVANNGAPTSTTNNGEFYAEDGTTVIVGSSTTSNPALIPVTVDGAGNVTNPAAATTEDDFKKTFTQNLGADAATGVIGTPLLMTGTGEARIAGSVSKVDITLRRIVARFDIENNVTKSNLTIQKVTLARGRTNGTLWGADRTVVLKDQASPLLATYQPVDFTKIPGANSGITESALYTYPNLDTDESFLILEGTYKSPISSEQVPVTYNVPIVRTAEGDAQGTYIPVKANSRYHLKITDVTQSNVFATFEVADWVSGGGIIVKPDNDAPIFDVANEGFEAVTGAAPTAVDDLENTFVVSEGSEFKVKIGATGKVRCEKAAATTKTASPEWLEIGPAEYKETDGVWYSTFTMKTNNATGELPVNVTFINETASYDPALWTVLTFYGPKAKPTLTDGGAGSFGNTVDYLTDPAAPTASMYNAVGGFIKVKAMCIEGTKLVLPAEFEQVGEPVKEGFFSTFTIQVKSTLTDGEQYDLEFQNAQEPATKVVVVVTAVDAGMIPLLGAGADTYASLTGATGVYTIKTDIEQLGSNTYTLNISAPQGVTAVLPTGKWLTVTEGTFSNGVTPYTIQITAGITDYTDFDLSFTNKLDATDKLTVTMNKAFSKPQMETAIGQSVFNEAPVFSDIYTGTVQMYAAEGSQVKVKMTCKDAAAFAAVSGLTITPEADDVYAIVVDANPSFTAGTTTVVEARNTQDVSSKATLTITWMSPDVKIALTANANVEESRTADAIVYTVDKSLGFDPLTFTVTAPKGATLEGLEAFGTADAYLKLDPDNNVGDGTIGEKVEEVYTVLISNPNKTADLTLTVKNAIPHVADQTITFKKKL